METRPNPGSSPPAPERSQLGGLDDAELVSLYLDGERFAFQELVNRYQERLLNFIYRTTRPRSSRPGSTRSRATWRRTS
jgi:RNA polymerase sigma-70 factor (ECF subfamily)